VEAVKQQVISAWDAASYPLTIEPEIFWRRGARPSSPTSAFRNGREKP